MQSAPRLQAFLVALYLLNGLPFSDCLQDKGHHHHGSLRARLPFLVMRPRNAAIYNRLRLMQLPARGRIHDLLFV